MASIKNKVFDVSKARASFPALKQDHQVYFDNAGGTQVLSDVATSIKDYLEETNVQLGATYNVSRQSTETYASGLKAAAGFINAEPDEIVIGPSTTQLYANLAQILNLPSNAEVILSSIDHEANISSWLRLAKLQNLAIKWWTPPKDSLLLTAKNLRPLLSDKTALVTCTHTSNVLGSIHDIKGIADEVHKIPGAKLCVDGVAYAPHREVDVKALGVDFYAFSWYKVYGPHIAILYASRSAQKTLSSLAHYFHTSTSLETRLGLASASYELVASIPRIVSYLSTSSDFNSSPKSKIWSAIAIHEATLSEILLSYLRSNRTPLGITVWGHESADEEKRVPVISFSVQGRNSREIVERMEQKSNFGCRWGHFYSKRLVDEVLGLGEGGVVRVSLVHYNTKEEVGRFVNVLNEVLEELEKGGMSDH